MLYYVNIDLHHQYGISLDKAEMSLLVKRPQLAARSEKRQMFSLASFFYGLDLCLSLVMDQQFACPEVLTTAQVPVVQMLDGTIMTRINLYPALSTGQRFITQWTVFIDLAFEQLGRGKSCLKDSAVFSSLYVSGKLPTYPSPYSPFCPK